MQNGWNERIEYMASDDTPRVAWLSRTDVNAKGVPFVEDCDPVEFFVYDSRNNTTTQTPEILIRATDNSFRKVWLDTFFHHASGPPADFNDFIYCQFLYADPDGDNEGNPQDHIYLVAPNGNHFRLQVSPFYNFPGNPGFVVSDYIA